MKNLEKALTNPTMQRAVYLLLLVFSLYIFSGNGVLRRAGSFTAANVSPLIVVIGLVALLGAQLIWNRKWLWMLLCLLVVCFTLWLATLSLSQIIANAGAPAKTVVWGFGVVGFTILLILFMAFLNWVVLHMKPKK